MKEHTIECYKHVKSGGTDCICGAAVAPSRSPAHRIRCGMCGDTGLQNGVKCPQTGCVAAGAAGPSEREAQFTEEFLKQVVELSEVLDKLRPGTGGAVAMFCQDAYEKGWQARAAVPQSSPSEREATSSGSRSDSSISTSNRIQASSEAGDGLSLPDLLSNVISHVEWVQSHGRMRAAQTSDDKEMNAFNHGRVDAAESILSFYEQEKRQARAAVPQAHPDLEYWKSRAETAELKVLTFYEEIASLRAAAVPAPGRETPGEAFDDENCAVCGTPESGHEIASQLHEFVCPHKQAIEQAIKYASGRWCKWGSRAESVRDILENAVADSGATPKEG
jgi:hypothetical protein